MPAPDDETITETSAIARLGVTPEELAALPDIERVELTPYDFARPWMAAFCSVLARSGDVSYACRVAQVNRGHVYNVRKTDAVFAAAWHEAEEVGTDFLEQVALRRATTGEIRTITKRRVKKVDGKTVEEIEATEEVVERSDGLLQFLLRARRPAVYRERIDHRVMGPGDGPLQVEVYRQPDPERIRELAHLVAAEEHPVIEGTATNGKPPRTRKKPTTTAARRRAAAKKNPPAAD